MPKRIQRKRTKGWRMPANAVYVGRPTKWGNPVSAQLVPDREDLVDCYRYFLEVFPIVAEHAIVELHGKDLVCWCPVDQPCHADVLLEVANPSRPRESEGLLGVGV